MAAPVVRFEIMRGKGNRLEKSYGDRFGWKIDSSNPMKDGIVDAGTQGGINGGVSPSQDEAKRVSVYVQVEDPDASLAKAEKLGGNTILPRQFHRPSGKVG